VYLKSLELQGFKSFADKTVLTFDRAMSAVVGPNGSGKSNIADAIRWVLGEQSTRTLRGAKMEDVIFGGTEKRAQVGFAEVSLILDNSDGALAIDAAEVMVTRRYYRSGESEYFINRAHARLRDIHELFMDTGLGRDGYSIIGQGRIDEILSVKSGDRREIFEEAAGISKFRYRKEEAQRKLDATRQNLLRVSDKLSELELTVGPLKEQAETARKYLALRDELRVTEVSLWLAQLERLAQTSEKTKADFAAANAQYESDKAALDGIYSRSEELASSMHELDIELEQLRAQLAAAEALEREAAGEMELAESRAAGYDENVERIRREMAEQQGREQSLAEQIAERENRIVEVEEELAKADRELSELSAELADLAERADAIAERADAINALVAENTARVSELAVERSSLESASAELEARSSSISEQLSEREKILSNIESDLEAKKKELNGLREEKVSLGNVINGYELRLASRRKKLDGLRETAQKLSVERSALESRAKVLSDMERDYEGFGRAVKIVMRDRDRIGGIHGTLSELITVEDEYAIAVETALGQSLQNIVVESDENGKAAVNYLKRCDGGRATFMPLSTMRGRALDEKLAGERGFVGIASDLVHCDARYRNIILYSLGRTVVAENMDSAIAISRRHSQRFRIVTLDGQVINSGGSITGGSLARGTGVLSRANELKRLEVELDELRAKQEKETADLRAVEREVNAAEYENDVARNELREAEENILRAEGEYNTLAAQLESVKQAAEAAEHELGENKARLEKIAARTAEIAAENERLAGERASLDEKLAELGETSSGIGGERGTLAERMSALRESRSGGISELETLRAGTEELRRVSENYGGDRERREAQIAELSASAAAERTLAEEKRTLAAERGEVCTKLRGELAARTSRKLALEAERTASDRELQDKNTALLNLERERGRLESKVSEAAIEERQLVDKLWESYELTVITAEEVAREIASISAAKNRASSLKREMNALGEVNVGAIDEYARISERYEFLSGQYADISGAAGELEGIIDEITGKMKEVFAVEFKRINETFASTFTEIFGGGSARLELEDENDILNCGIEIRVQPPGKSLKTITLLSGGEKAFVAIALYFAILKVRPTPFCVLDEVDTALDDVNVRRFAEYMGSIDAGTQFILITHKRGTMEQCDILYGVTMPTPGVSRVLALNMNDVERELGVKLK